MDKGMTTKIIAVVVVIIIVAAAAVVLLNNKGDDSTPGTVEVGAIYGNVNGDYYIDQTDIDLVQDVIDGKKTLADWPLADANVDGTVDSTDLEIVRTAAAGNSTTLYVVNYLGENVAVNYPVSNYATTGGTNFRSVVAVLGLANGMLANGTNSYISATLDKALYEGREDGTITKLSGTSLTTADVDTLISLKTSIVISEENGMSSTSEIVQLLTGAGIQYLELNFKDTTTCAKSIKSLGILFGKEDTAKEYNEWTESIMNTITSNEGDKFGTATVLTVTMSNSVSGTESDYYAASNEVGGNNIADWTDKTRKVNTGDTWILEYKADYIFHFKSEAFPKEISESTISNYSSYFKETDTYKNGGYYLINGVLPLPVRNAVMAEIMYSDCFDEGWAESLFQYYFTHFLGQDFDVSSVTYVWNVTD